MASRRRGGKASAKRKATAQKVKARVADTTLDNFITNNYQDLKDQAPGIASIVTDMPAKFADNFVNSQGQIGNPTPGEKSRYYRADGSLNAAGQSILNHYSDDRSEYGRQMNRLRTSSPAMDAAYARKFPLTNFAMKGAPLVVGAMTGIPFGLLEKGFDKTKQGFNFAKTGAGKGLDAILSGIDKGMSAAESGLDRLSGDTGNMIQDTGEIIRNTGTDVKENIFGTDDQNIFAQPGDDFLGLSDAEYAQYQRNKLNQLPQRDNRINPLAEMLALNTSTDTPGIERIFKLPGDFRGDFNNQYFTGVPDRSLKENYLVRQPEINALMGMNLNQGGLASLNNPDYNRLMGASNFGF